MTLSLVDRKKEIDRITLWGVVVNIVLAVGKILVGFMSNSHALIADGVHSLSDLISDGMVLMAAKHSHLDADDEHPYGHGRYETLATIGVGLFLIIIALGIGIDAIMRLAEPATLTIPGTLALVIAAVSILSKEVLYQLTMSVARRIKSKMLIANAWHHRTDSISSIVVFIGIAGAIWGWPILDDVAAIVVAIMIGHIGWQLSHSSVQELVDTALEPEKLDEIRNRILAVDGVEQLHMLRTRRSGHQALVDVHILVDSNLSVSEGHQIAEAVTDTLTSNFEEINDVTIHIDPEDDEITPNSCKTLPLRTELIELLKQAWSDIPEIHQMKGITLHYLDGMVNVEIVLPLTVLDNLQAADRLNAKLFKAAEPLEHIRKVDVFYT
ncbi:MAG: cation transporter [Gammaproteobacteria bacterium]|nr:MAG: cation transporter [Gammaproteobacteria bacterium]